MAKAAAEPPVKPGWWSRIKDAAARVDHADRLRIARGLLHGVALAVVGAGGLWALDHMDRQVHRQVLRQAPPRLVLMAPTWMHDGWVRSVGQSAGLRAGDQLADADLVPRLAADLAANPWVARVVEVRKFTDGRVVAHCQFRQPAAVVKSGPAYYLVDREAVVLKVASADELDHLGLLRIYGTREMAPDEGQVWPGRDIRAGLRLADLLERQPFRTQLDSIDVTNYGGLLNDRAAQLVINTNMANRTIRWGRAPGEEEGKENPAQIKLQLLQMVHERKKRVDANSDFVDVRFDRYAVDVAEPPPRRPTLRG